MQKVCHISTVHHISDTRVFYKECKTVASRGFDVYLLITNDKAEKIDGVNIVPFKKRKSRIARLLLNSNFAWIKALRTKSKIFHLHDPELIYSGLILKCFGKKVVYDMHELVYHQISDKNWLGGKFVRRIVRGIYKGYESLAVRFFDYIVLAEDGYKDYFDKHYKKRLHKIVFIRNYPMIDVILSYKRDRQNQNKMILTYAGGLTKIRGIKEVCDAVKDLDLPVEFEVMGKWQDEEYRKACTEGNDKVKDYGLLKLEQVYEKMINADVGVCNLYFVDNYLTSLPVKSFEYMICSLPMLMSEFPYWKEIYSDCAVFVNPVNVDDIREKIKWCYENQDKIREMGEEGKRIAVEKYSWSAELDRLVGCYEKLK
ncbi:glycosyltransferase family 4 protein [Paracrocinitomix mangrovi]|uniref:glycosyltransferase family 4 protein n=1 Tax=Paracrocinitomix mangrovi TaxID=2862509 RepID=UPI001C8D1224|nr:glycosyltransferase family 4 protein [Paracrocinitomix mangrovi]UKN03307.1 glycosyltransferase family 4 protein [Paracrocinitomix mangrovi]